MEEGGETIGRSTAPPRRARSGGQHRPTRPGPGTSRLREPLTTSIKPSYTKWS